MTDNSSSTSSALTTTLSLTPQQQQLAIVLAAASGANQLALLSQPRDEFQMMADKDFFGKIVRIGNYLNALRFYRKGVDKHHVFTFGFIRDAFGRALKSLGNDTLNIDQWYFDMLEQLPEKEAYEARFGTSDPDERLVHKLAESRGEHAVDWIGGLQTLEMKTPGLVNALSSAIEQQNMTQESALDEYKRAMNYARGQEAPTNMGKHIYHGVKPPSTRPSIGGKVIGGY